LAQVLSVEGLEQGDVVVFLGLLPPPFLFLVAQDEVIAREVSQVQCVEVADGCFPALVITLVMGGGGMKVAIPRENLKIIKGRMACRTRMGWMVTRSGGEILVEKATEVAAPTLALEGVKELGWGEPCSPATGIKKTLEKGAPRGFVVENAEDACIDPVVIPDHRTGTLVFCFVEDAC